MWCLGVSMMHDLPGLSIMHFLPNRPGRFDHVVEVPLADEAGRLEILIKATSGMPHREDVDLGQIARATHTYTGLSC